MSQAYNNVWIHAVWNTKFGIPLIEPQAEKEIHAFMRSQFEAMGCLVSIINGMPDHVHCLFRISLDKSIADIIRQVKGSTSFYINEKN